MQKLTVQKIKKTKADVITVGWFCVQQTYRVGQKMWHYTFVHIFANY